MYKPYTLDATRGKCRQFSSGFNILDNLDDYAPENQNPSGDLDFLSFVYKSIGSSEVIFVQNFGFSEISFKIISFVKLSPEATLG